MIIDVKRGEDILRGNEKRIAFAINQEGFNDSGFAGVISRKGWRELANLGETELGTSLTKKIDGIEYIALCCHSLRNGWTNQREVIRKCFDSIPGDEPIATIAIGTGYVGMMSGANFDEIRAGMELSHKKIILYN